MNPHNWNMRNSDDDETENSFQSLGAITDRLISKRVKSGKLPEMPKRTSVVGSTSERGRFKSTEVNSPIVDDDASGKSAVRGSIDALKSRTGSDPPLVRVVFLARGLAQIHEGVVMPAPVNVIDQPIRPNALYIEPRQPRSAIENAPNVNEIVAAKSASAASRAPDQIATIGFYPRKDARSRVVMQRGFQLIKRDHASIPNQQNEGTNKGGRSDSSEEKRETHREAVEQRLRDLAAFERRARGDQKPSKRTL